MHVEYFLDSGSFSLTSACLVETTSELDLGDLQVDKLIGGVPLREGFTFPKSVVPVPFLLSRMGHSQA